MATLPYMKCSLPSCSNTVGQHDKAKNVNKQLCEAHRKSKKIEADKWKLNQGCNNTGQYGFPCTTSEIIDSCQLDINHIDGNNNNRNPSNIEVLCSNCHRVVTIRNEHHKQANNTRKPKYAKTGLFSDLID